MATVEQALSVARGELGYSRWTDPQEGTKYGRDYATRHGAYFGASGVPYCAMFVTWVLRQVGMTPPGGDFAYVPSGINAARNLGRLVSAANAQAGDLVCFDWDGDGVADHVGFVERNYGSYYQTIEGNTSSGASGSQSNGGGVYRRTRNLGSVIAVIRPEYTGASASSWELEEDGIWGARTGRRFRQVFAVPANAGWEPTAVRALQYFLSWALDAYRLKAATGVDRIPVDGFDGPITIGAFQTWWNASGIPAGHRIPVTKTWDAETVKAMQIALNHSWAGSKALGVKP